MVLLIYQFIQNSFLRCILLSLSVLLLWLIVVASGVIIIMMHHVVQLPGRHDGNSNKKVIRIKVFGKSDNSHSVIYKSTV